MNKGRKETRKKKAQSSLSDEGRTCSECQVTCMLAGGAPRRVGTALDQWRLSVQMGHYWASNKHTNHCLICTRSSRYVSTDDFHKILSRRATTKQHFSCLVTERWWTFLVMYVDFVGSQCSYLEFHKNGRDKNCIFYHLSLITSYNSHVCITVNHKRLKSTKFGWHTIL